MIRTLSLLILPLALASLAPPGAPAAQPSETNAFGALLSVPPAGERVVARGTGFEITRSQLDEEIARAQAQAVAQGRRIPSEVVPQLHRDTLEQLINVQLLEAKATAADKAAGKEQAQKRLTEAKAKAGSEEAFAGQLKRMGATADEVLAKWAEALTADAVLERELKIKVTDQDVRKEYDANTNQFQAPEKVRISHILIGTRDRASSAQLLPDEQAAKRKQAEALLKRARAGEDFAKLAHEYSDDLVSKDRGGEYTFAHGEMVPEVENAAFALKPNDISDIVVSAYGFHIIKLNERIPAHQIKFADAAGDIKAALIAQAIQQQFPDYIANLRKEAGVEILDAKLRPRTTMDPDSYIPPIRPVPRPQTP
jgi:parvulin-like peptidyl-prolyl isomerase